MVESETDYTARPSHMGSRSIATGVPQAPRLSLSRARIDLSSWRALGIVTLAYGSAIYIGCLLLSYVQKGRVLDDLRDEQVMLAFVAIMGLGWLVSTMLVLRRH